MQKNYTFISSLFLAIFYSIALLGAPIVTNVNPNFGPASGGNMVTITGSGFTGATAVDFGATPAVFTVNSDISITATAPIGSVGDVNIIVTTPSGSSTPGSGSDYVYQGSWFAYVTSIFANSITPINLSTNTPGTAFTGASGFTNPVITPDGRTLYVADEESNFVAVFNLATNTLITTIPVTAPGGMAISPDGAFIYAANERADTITKISTATNTVVTTIPTGVAGGNPVDVAITSDGTTAYVVNLDANNVTPINLTTNIAGAAIPVGVGPRAIAITPNGQTAYVVNFNSGTLTPITIATNIPSPAITVGFGQEPTGLAITPNGTAVYVVNSLANSVAVVDIATNTVVANVSVGTLPQNIAITPDSKFAYVVNSTAPGSVSVIDTATNTVVDTIPLSVDLMAIVISPDQAPVAAFSFTSPNTFDASASVTAVGSIATYAWDFGDGTTLVTTSPIVTHNYAASGMYVVTLTVTNTAGTSTTQTYTGHMFSNHGGPSATITEVITVIIPPPPPVPPSPPSHFAGKTIENKFATQTDIIHRLKWKPSPDPSVSKYELFRNGKLIAVVPASGPFVYLDHNRRENVPDIYTLIAITASGVQSLPVIAVVP